jgi:hypothetical protein
MQIVIQSISLAFAKLTVTFSGVAISDVPAWALVAIAGIVAAVWLLSVVGGRVRKKSHKNGSKNGLWNCFRQFHK